MFVGYIFAGPFCCGLQKQTLVVSCTVPQGCDQSIHLTCMDCSLSLCLPGLALRLSQFRSMSVSLYFRALDQTNTHLNPAQRCGRGHSTFEPMSVPPPPKIEHVHVYPPPSLPASDSHRNNPSRYRAPQYMMILKSPRPRGAPGTPYQSHPMVT